MSLETLRLKPEMRLSIWLFSTVKCTYHTSSPSTLRPLRGWGFHYTVTFRILLSSRLACPTGGRAIRELLFVSLRHDTISNTDSYERTNNMARHAVCNATFPWLAANQQRKRKYTRSVLRNAVVAEPMSQVVFAQCVSHSTVLASRLVDFLRPRVTCVCLR